MTSSFAVVVMFAAGCAHSTPNPEQCKPVTSIAEESRPTACVVEPAESEQREAQRDSTAEDPAEDYDLCIAKEREVLKLEDSPRVRLHLASC